MNLPESFSKRMQSLLADEFEAFLQAFDQPRYYGLRVNTLKWSVEEALSKLPFPLTPIPWVEEGFYYPEEERPAKHPYYQAGLYYIQEPSAMAPGALIPIEPGDRVLDLCAAPGGKTTQVAARLKGQGVLVSNDINNERIKALVRNIELCGVRNAIVTNETPERLALTFANYFDKILIDAPCSGEGMFRKNPEMIKSWESHTIAHCAGLQKDILHEASKMLRVGGYILYSTCTFAPEENEQQIAHFLNAHPEFVLEQIESKAGFQPGQRDWSGTDAYPFEKTARLWPHQLHGEGHYVALLKKTDGEQQQLKSEYSSLKEKDVLLLRQFEKEVLSRPLLDFTQGDLALFKGHLYVKPSGLPALDKLKVIKSGWYLGELKKNRFEPSQSFAMGLCAEEVQPEHVLRFSTDSSELKRYLKGETLYHTGVKGWKLVTVDGYPLGWAKQTEGILKNAYPAGWRWLA